MSPDAQERERNQGGHRGAPLSEWIMAIVSSVLVLGMLAFTLAEAFRRPGGPARMSVQVDSVVRINEGYLALISLRNDGGETAASVQVHGELRSGAERVEESQVTLDYVPVGADRSAALNFRNDPAAHRLVVRVVGFTPP